MVSQDILGEIREKGTQNPGDSLLQPRLNKRFSPSRKSISNAMWTKFCAFTSSSRSKLAVCLTSGLASLGTASRTSGSLGSDRAGVTGPQRLGFLDLAVGNKDECPLLSLWLLFTPCCLLAAGDFLLLASWNHVHGFIH